MADVMRNALDKARAKKLAGNGPGESKPSTAKPVGEWRSDLVMEKGSIVSTAANIAIILAHHEDWSGRVRYNSFAHRVELSGDLPTIGGFALLAGPIKDETYTSIAAWLHSAEGVRADVSKVAQGVSAAARQREFNPLTALLLSLRWDGEPRVGKLFTHYVVGESEQPGYLESVGKAWMVSAVARAIVPGTKADHVPVIDGPQGIGKSSAIRALAGAQYFTDEMPDLASKDSSQFVRGTWIIELGELDAMTRGEVERTKAFITRCVDRYRPSYGRETVEVPRTCVFVGTTNASTYLKDSTGARRFWPVRARSVDVAAIARDRDQLWAEAVSLYSDGKTWWPDAAMAASASAEQATRQELDPWHTLVEDHVCDLARRTGSPEVTISAKELLLGPIAKPQANWTRADDMRVGAILRALGFERAKRRVDGHPRWVYFGSVPTVPTSLERVGTTNVS